MDAGWIPPWHSACLTAGIQGFTMSHSNVRSRVFVAVAAAAALLCAAVEPAVAQSRARLSKDVAERIAQRIEAPTEIIVDVAPDRAQALAARYGARLKKLIRGGAVFEATGGQIDALSQDPEVPHISGNARVFRMMAVTTAATGADQVWRGLEPLRGVTGAGVGIAVIDSGIANHAAVRDRVVAAVDFTAKQGPGKDAYGHGTHVAGIIAQRERDGAAGMAPGAWLVNLKVLGADGSGTTDAVIEAIDWAIAHRQAYNIRIIN